MTSKKKVETPAEEPVSEMPDPFLGGEEDDLSDMQYIQDETTTTLVDTHPPETEAEAELLAEQVAAEEEAKDDTDEPKSDDSDDDAPAEDDDAVPEEEAEAVQEEAEEEPVVEDEIKVPKDRFDEVNGRMKKAETEVESLKRQLEGVVEEKNAPEPAPPYDYATKEKAAMDALLEGDQDQYAALRAEIREAERAETLVEARKVAESGDIKSREDVSFNEAGFKIESDFPAFDIESETYNEEAREEMIDLYVGFAQSGKYTRVEALQRAAAKTARMYQLTASDVPVDDIPDNVLTLKPTDVKGKAKVANNQPPEIAARAEGESDEPRVDVLSMSDEQFDALPESTKRRIRGDVV